LLFNNNYLDDCNDQIMEHFRHFSELVGTYNMSQMRNIITKPISVPF
jgi:hypothetical protein